MRAAREHSASTSSMSNTSSSDGDASLVHFERHLDSPSAVDPYRLQREPIGEGSIASWLSDVHVQIALTIAPSPPTAVAIDVILTQ